MGLHQSFGALGKVYCDFVRGERDLEQSDWKTKENTTALAETAKAIKLLQVTLPTEVLDMNRSVRPDRMQALYDRLKQFGEQRWFHCTLRIEEPTGMKQWKRTIWPTL